MKHAEELHTVGLVCFRVPARIGGWWVLRRNAGCGEDGGCSGGMQGVGFEGSTITTTTKTEVSGLSCLQVETLLPICKDSWCEQEWVWLVCVCS